MTSDGTRGTNQFDFMLQDVPEELSGSVLIHSEDDTHRDGIMQNIYDDIRTEFDSLQTKIVQHIKFENRSQWYEIRRQLRLLGSTLEKL